jgi:hypothetical protein
MPVPLIAQHHRYPVILPRVWIKGKASCQRLRPADALYFVIAHDRERMRRPNPGQTDAAARPATTVSTGASGSRPASFCQPHDWDDERSGEIFNNIRRVIDPSGRLVVVEIVLPPMNGPHIGPLIDLNMMVMTGGAERTEVEYRDLLAKSGFRMERVAAARAPFSVIEAAPV